MWSKDTDESGGMTEDAWIEQCGGREGMYACGSGGQTVVDVVDGIVVVV